MKIISENRGKESAEERQTQDEEMKLKYEENQFLKEPKCLSFVKVNPVIQKYLYNRYLFA